MARVTAGCLCTVARGCLFNDPLINDDMIKCWYISVTG